MEQKWIHFLLILAFYQSKYNLNCTVFCDRYHEGEVLWTCKCWWCVKALVCFLSWLLLGGESYCCSHKSFRDYFRSWRGHCHKRGGWRWNQVSSFWSRLHHHLVSSAGQVWHGIHCIFQQCWHEKAKYKASVVHLHWLKDLTKYPHTAVIQRSCRQRRLQLCNSLQRYWTEIRRSNSTGWRWALFHKFGVIVIWWMFFSPALITYLFSQVKEKEAQTTSTPNDKEQSRCTEAPLCKCSNSNTNGKCHNSQLRVVNPYHRHVFWCCEERIAGGKRAHALQRKPSPPCSVLRSYWAH